MRNRTLFVVVASFSLLLLLIVVSGLVSVNRANEIFRQVEEINSSYERIQTSLDQVRARIFLLGIAVRDLMLDSQSAQAVQQRGELQRARDSVDDQLEGLRIIAPVEMATEIEEIRDEVESYWASLAPVIDGSRERSIKEFAAIYRQLVARRDSALAIVERIQVVSRVTFQRQQESLLKTQQNFVRNLSLASGIMLFIGLAVAAVSGYRAFVLQGIADRHQEETKNAEGELRKLSSQLVRAQEEERRRISRELHDEVGQTLTALGMELGNLGKLRGHPGEQFDQHLTDAKRLAQDTLKTVRELAMGLRPSMLDDYGLTPALRWQAREFTRRSGMEVTVDIQGDVDKAPDSLRTCIYRIVQEALTNAARHSRARRVMVRVQGTPRVVEVSVSDDGVGFAMTPKSGGMGLVGIEERVRELGGRLIVDSGPDRGTRIRAELPAGMVSA